MEAIRPVARTLLRDRAYQAIRDAIVAGEIEPGAVVRDAEFAELLGLSRAPVREAFSRLVDEGLLESKPQSYTRVTAVVASDVRDAAAVVGAMHELVARTAVPRLFAADVEMMRSANERFAAAVRTGDVDAALVADDELHDVLVRVSGNRAAAATVARYTPLIRRLERRRFGEGGNCRSAGLHEQLIAACAAGDTDGAVRVTAEIWRGLAALADEPDEQGEPTGGASAVSTGVSGAVPTRAEGALPATAGAEGDASPVSAEAAGGSLAASAGQAAAASAASADETVAVSVRPLDHESAHQPAREPGDVPVRRADR
ncbi:GntR family transcriptional regulator [Streptomyces scabiei]|uniref:GntR family transcriptional regulator n=1 Tax=Streptomyces scabiei TaxID=1930 RepID=UPI00298FAF3E|nr:GntR family transcriptional regulator [Streptomyces scabiei]MDW8810347.1 GntR family transcriptional regulator [Streptomyces scabiei]